MSASASGVSALLPLPLLLPPPVECCQTNRGEATTPSTPPPPSHLDARACPWCNRPALKDAACNWVCCGVDTVHGFREGEGCARQWCFRCEKKLCGAPMHGPGATAGVRTSHDAHCCRAEAGFHERDYCRGGHNSHVARRW